MKIRRLATGCIAILMALVTAVVTPLNTLAASKDQYISEVVTYYADSYEEAAEGLTALGYTPVKNSNLNSTLETGVYLGYITTDDPDEAITDLAVMNMTGSYSYTDYEEILNTKREEIEDQLEKLMPAIEAFQDSYDAETVSGQIVYAALNQYYEDDSMKNMGDILLDYDFGTESKKELTEIFLQGSSTIILNIIQTLALTAGYGEDSILDRMANYGYESVLDRYEEKYSTASKAKAAMNRELRSTVINIENSWDDLQDILEEAEKYITIGEDGPSVNMPEMTSDEEDYEAIEQSAILEKVNLYLALYYTDFGNNTTALDYFTQEIDISDPYDMYLLADCMTEAQASLLDYISLFRLLTTVSYSLDDGSDEAEETLKNYQNMTGVATSVYAGIDRTYFEEGVAFTSEATTHESVTGASWSPEATSINWLAATIATSALTIACVGTGIGVLSYAEKQFSKAAAPLEESVVKALEKNETIAARLKTASASLRDAKDALVQAKNKLNRAINNFARQEALAEVKECEVLVSQEKKVYENLCDKSLAAGNNLDKAKTALKDINDSGIARSFKIFSCVMFALAIVFAILDIISIIGYLTTEERNEESIPVHLVTALEDGDGRTDYVYYSTVKNQDDEPADLNNHEGDASIGWLVLYYSKDALAGDPITVSALKTQTGSNTVSENDYGIHLFNEEAPANLTAEKYTGVSDSANGTYVLFERAVSSTVGSAFSTGTTVIFAGVSLIAGIAIGTIIARLGGRKKRVQPA